MGKGGGGGGKGRWGAARGRARGGGAKAIRRSTRSILSENDERRGGVFTGATRRQRPRRRPDAHLQSSPRQRTSSCRWTHQRRGLVGLPPTRRHGPERGSLLPGTDLHDQRMSENRPAGLWRCLPAAALDPKRGWDVVDCCAFAHQWAALVRRMHSAAGEPNPPDAFVAARMKRLARNVATASSAGAIVDAQATRPSRGGAADPWGRCGADDAERLDTIVPRDGLRGGRRLPHSRRADPGDACRRERSRGVGARGCRRRESGTTHHRRIDLQLDKPCSGNMAAFQLRALRREEFAAAPPRLSYSTCSRRDGTERGGALARRWWATLKADRRLGRSSQGCGRGWRLPRQRDAEAAGDSRGPVQTMTWSQLCRGFRSRESESRSTELIRQLATLSGEVAKNAAEERDRWEASWRHSRGARRACARC